MLLISSSSRLISLGFKLCLIALHDPWGHVTRGLPQLCCCAGVGRWVDSIRVRLERDLFSLVHAGRRCR
ncbi:hypothetical protein KC19_1G093000 [Ceratodon purpureus]|uniref:Uncharacterized protein n=1 Tax=Ceratodon purpureus TaxID=3225 RepID=A0A8T0J425_CERPU|nr:hypothetical protein KC19_1G093000 [Ceratodon purpureus]